MNESYKLDEAQEIRRKKIAEGWTYEQEHVLKIWAEKASGWAWLHDKSSRYFEFFNNLYVYPTIILSSISGGLGFIVSGGHSQAGFIVFQTITYFVSATHIICAIMVSFQKFKRSAERIENHLHMAKTFSSYARKIVLELAMNPEDRRSCNEFCIGCKEEYDRLILDSPQIPEYVLRMFSKQFPNVKHKPEVTNGLIHFDDTPSNRSSFEEQAQKSSGSDGKKSDLSQISIIKTNTKRRSSITEQPITPHNIPTRNTSNGSSTNPNHAIERFMHEEDAHQPPHKSFSSHYPGSFGSYQAHHGHHTHEHHVHEHSHAQSYSTSYASSPQAPYRSSGYAEQTRIQNLMEEAYMNMPDMNIARSNTNSRRTSHSLAAENITPIVEV
jgi:hypothetical protein